MSLVARHAALTDIGLHRSTNEDAFVAEPPLFAVADGMGGAQAGEVASHLALETLVEALAANADADADAEAGAGADARGDADARGAAVEGTRGDAAQGARIGLADAAEGARVDLADAALAANASVYQRSRTDRAHSGMGTTLTAALLGDDRLEFAHVGDSRLYLWRDERLEQITDDHSLVGEMVRAGQLTPEAALTHPHRSILSRALGTEPRVEVDSGALELQAGDAVVLCSDGLYSMISEETFAAVLAAVDDPWRVARQLIREAKNEGGHDNITVIVLRFDEAGEGAGEPAPDDAATAVLPAVDDAAATGVLPALDTAAAGGVQLSLDDPGGGDDAPTAPLSDEVADAPPADDAAPAAEAEPAAAPAADAEPAAAPAAADAAADAASPAAAADAPPRRHRRRWLWLVVALIALLAVCLVAGAVVADGVYYVGDHDGMVSVYRGLPLRVAGVELNRLYLQTTTPFNAVPTNVLAQIQRHDLHRRAAAMALVDKAASTQGFPP